MTAARSVTDNDSPMPSDRIDLTCTLYKNIRMSADIIAMWTRLYYSVDLRIQTYTEPGPLNLKYGKLATKYP